MKLIRSSNTEVITVDWYVYKYSSLKTLAGNINTKFNRKPLVEEQTFEYM